MKKIKKTIALILCLIMAIGSMSIAFGDDTKDFVGHWAEATIQKWIDEGKISGYPDGTFKPDGSITRAEFVKMVNGIIDYDGKGSITFDDVKKEDWFYDQIKIAQEIGYISGYSKTQFGPNDNITREQAAAILSRIQYLKDNSSAVNKFIDNTNISSWAVGSVGAASSNGFINGHSDGSFKPKDNLSRAEAVTMLDNVLLNAKNYIVYKDGTELNDKEIAGDLIIAKTVGDGDVYLNNIDVKGHIYVYGGGINSVYFNNVKVARIEVNKDKVRLVFDDGTTVEEIALGTEAKLENINGEIGKISIDSQGKVTLSGKFADVEVVSDSDIELSNATIENLVVNKPIKILGTGTISTLTANADGIQYESTAKITKTVVGESVTEKPVAIVEEPSTGGGGGGGGGDSGSDTTPVVKVTAELKEGTTSKKLELNAEYTSSSIISDLLISEIKGQLNGNEDILNKYAALAEKRLKGIEIDGIPLYVGDVLNDTLWDKVTGYVSSLELAFKDNFNGELKKELNNGLTTVDLVKFLSLYDAYKQDGGALNTELLLTDANKVADKLGEKADKIVYTGQGTFEIKIDNKETIREIDKAINLIVSKIAFSTKTVDKFFNEFGEIAIEGSYGDKTFTIIIKKTSL